MTEKRLSIRAAPREVEKLTNGLVTADRAKDVYRRRAPGANAPPKPPPGETCTVSDL
jgi:hypothetical protein